MSATSRLAAARARWRLEGVRVPATALWVAAICVMGLGLRLAWVLYTDTIPLGGDPHWYYVVAINLTEGNGFVSNSNPGPLGEVVGPGEPTAFWPPAYPIVLAGFWKVFGVGLTSAKVLNAVFGALTIPFVYGLGRALFDERSGLLGAGLFALFPNAIAWTPLLFPEQLFVLLFVAALWLLVAFRTVWRGHLVALLAFGALVGVATLTRGQGAVLVPIAAVYWFGRSGWRPALRSTALAVLAAAAVIAPWTIRNWVELDAFVPISANAGTTLRIGHAPDSTGTTKWTSDYIDGFYMWQSLYRPDWEVKGNREYTRRAITYALTHPKRELELSGNKVYHLYRSDSGVIPWLTTLGATPIEPAAVEEALWHVFDVSYYTAGLLALVAIPVLVWRRRWGGLVLVNVLGVWTLYHIVFQGEPRYHVPLFPVFAIATAAGVFAALDWRRPRRKEQG